MNPLLLHPWKVTPKEAIQIQEKLRGEISLRPPKGPFKIIAASDVAYRKAEEKFYAGVLLFSFPDLTLLEKTSAKGKARFPYIPGLLTFREAPILLKAFSKLPIRPDLILVDGQGIAHPRSMGIAAHLGLLLDLPSIGCAKSRLIGVHGELGRRKGSVVPLFAEDQEKDRTIGMVVRTREGVKPVFVSPGHKVDMRTSVKMVLALSRGYRIPEPLRQAHIFVSSLRKSEE
jgi:deoxyribonuclease V